MARVSSISEAGRNFRQRTRLATRLPCFIPTTANTSSRNGARRSQRARSSKSRRACGPQRANIAPCWSAPPRLGARGFLFATLADEERLTNAGAHGTSLGCEAPFPNERFRGKSGAGVSANDENAAYFDELNKQKPKGDAPFKYLPKLGACGVVL